MAGIVFAVGASACWGAPIMDGSTLLRALTPQPQQLAVHDGALPLRGTHLSVRLPAGPEHEACRQAVTEALEAAGVLAEPADSLADGDGFAIGSGPVLPELPRRGPAPDEAYVLAVGPEGIAARGASPVGLLYAAQTLRQLLRLSASSGRLSCLAIADWPDFRLRGVYIEGGQERFGRIVDAEYLREQIRRLSEFKLNALVVECYNLFPYASFPECADGGTLSPEDCRAIVAASKRWHVTLIPSLQTLAQAYELVWQCDAGAPYRESTAPGLTCPSTPEVYPFIKGLYRDLLTWFGDSPLIGIGCSEIDMQWQGRYCPKCQARVAAGETVRDLLLGHAEKCIAAVHQLSAELGRPIRPLMWGDEFYMYGPGRDWVGLERIPRDTVMGFWKYWPDYAGIEGLFARRYDVLGISAMYNHCFYLADLSPADPPKSWPSMAQTGVVNITGMMQAADAARRAHPDREFLGAATASFSKHRLRAFDSICYGFALNGHCSWSHPARPLEEYQPAFTHAFCRHYYDCRTDQTAGAVAAAYERLDHCKSLLELANQTLHDVVGVYDTQEAGYTDNTLLGALHTCGKLVEADGTLSPELATIRANAQWAQAEATSVEAVIEAQRLHVGAVRELGDLWLAAEKIAAHAEREQLMIDTQVALAQAKGARPIAAGLAGRWTAHRGRVERILARVSPLYSRGDPCGLQSVLQDVRTIEAGVAEPAPLTPGEGASLLLTEEFAALDPQRWIVRGEPKVVDGRLETRAPGGFTNYCGITTQQAFALEDERPLVVEFEVTPLEPGVDSQLFASGSSAGDLAFQFCFYCPRTRFGVHTQCSAAPGGAWVSGEGGWKPRAMSPAITVGITYRVQARITRRSFRVVVWEAGQPSWQLPLWDTLAVPMDELSETRLLFADVEPPNATAATRWGPIKVWRASKP